MFLKELKPHFEKYVAYFDETLTSFDLSAASLMHTVSISYLNIDVANKDNLFLTNNLHFNLMKHHHKRHLVHVNEICKLIGTNHILYEFTMETLSILYSQTRNWFYSTLRAQIIARLSEIHSHEVFQTILHKSSHHSDSLTEMILKYSSLISVCLKEKVLGTKRAKELETIVESKKFNKILP